MKKQRLVVIGNGMAGARVVEEIIERSPDKFEIIMFGAEPYGNYNRISLSNVLNQTKTVEDIFINPLDWYQKNNILLYTGARVVAIDRKDRRVLARKLTDGEAAYLHDAPTRTRAGLMEEHYDQLIIATGSRPAVPPLEGFGLAGTFVFRTIDDCRHIAGYAEKCHKAVVMGGGILGLEAARGLLTHHLEVTVLEAAPQLMPAQLDQEAAAILEQSLAAMGIRVLTNVRASRIEGREGRVSGVALSDGRVLETDLVVVSIGIRPITEIAGEAGLAVNKGIICDDQMRTSDPSIFALGECIEHRGKLYGLVEPIWEQARVLADILTSSDPNARYEGTRAGTKLKVMGVELVAIGEKDPSDPADELIVYRDPYRRVYKKLIIRNGQIHGAILLGEIEFADTLLRLYSSGGALPEKHAELLFGSVTGATMINAKDLPDQAQICNCNGVSKRVIVDAIVNKGCSSVSAVGDKTKAGKGCGSCKGLIAQLIEWKRGQVEYDPRENYYVPGVPLEKSQLVAQIMQKHLTSVSAVFQELASGKEDPDSKTGLASLLKILWPKEYQDERDARFINDRVHANIQKDGTFSVVPRVYAGVITPQELMKIAQVAQKYNVPMVKLTGGQRIDLLGVKKEDLPHMWKDLGMPSGHAYAKTMRTCKSCVGIDFCRYGLGASIKLASVIEHRFQGIETPHKMKMAVAGCPRNCSEALIKDVGVVAIEGGKWEVYIGGGAASIIRKADLLCVEESEEAVVRTIGRFMQYYREHAKYAERTYSFVARLGVEVLKNILIKDSLGINAQLDERMQTAVDAYCDPWQEADIPAYPSQFEGPQLVQVLKDVENNG